jgi:nitric oxide reductase activation protein
MHTTVGHGVHLKQKIPGRFQSKVLPMIIDELWYVPNTVIRKDLQTPTVKEEIRHYSSQYSDDPVVNLMSQSNSRQLRRHLPNDLPAMFLV